MYMRVHSIFYNIVYSIIKYNHTTLHTPFWFWQPPSPWHPHWNRMSCWMTPMMISWVLVGSSPMSKSLRAAVVEGKCFKQYLHSFLRAYRSTPQSTTGKSPAELLYGTPRPFLTRLPEMRSDNETRPACDDARQADKINKGKMKKYYDERHSAKPSQLKSNTPALYIICFTLYIVMIIVMTTIGFHAHCSECICAIGYLQQEVKNLKMFCFISQRFLTFTIMQTIHFWMIENICFISQRFLTFTIMPTIHFWMIYRV